MSQCPRCKKNLSDGINQDNDLYHIKCLKAKEAYRLTKDKYYKFEDWVDYKDGERFWMSDQEHAVIIRGRIWRAVSKKYIRQLALMKALRIYWNNKGSRIRNQWRKNFIPSVIDQFKARGYLSNKQWELVDNIVDGGAYENGFHQEFSKIFSDMDSGILNLADQLQIKRKEKSFIKWYNKENNIEE